MVVSVLGYDIVDVFTDRPFAGNQLAVVHAGKGLTSEQCLAIAREFRLSETTFPVPEEATSYSVRIFTPGGEIPFAGHPTLGTAWVLRSRTEVADGVVTQRCGVGDIPVAFGDDGMVELTATPRDLVGPLDKGLVEGLLADIGLGSEDLAGEAYLAGAGLDFVHVPVREDAVPRSRPPSRRLAEHPGMGRSGVRDPVEGINVYAVSGSAPVQVRSRVFVPDLSIPEDPATGSAAAGLGMVLVATGLLRDGGRYDVTQGVEMGRPSQMHGRVEAADGAATRCHIAGRVCAVTQGEIAVPPQTRLG